MKKKILIALLIAILVLSAAAFTACHLHLPYKEQLSVRYNTLHYVYEGDSLDSLKPYLTVVYKKWYTVERPTEYEIVGTLTEGTCPITVHYRDISKTIDIKVLTISDAFEFQLDDNGESYSITKVGLVNAELIIPSEYCGKPVTEIGDNAFTNSKLTSVTIPDTVTKIGNYAFDTCYNLKNVALPNGLTEIGNNAFTYCIDLTSINIPDSVTEIGSYAFWGCESMTDVTISNSLTTINIGLFSSCSSLTSITIPDSVTEIDRSALSHCSGLASIVIPDSVTKIDSGAFFDCANLNTIFYKGTADDWAKISIDNSYGYNNNLTNATRYYYETNPQLNDDGTAYIGNYWHYVNDQPSVWVKD